APTSLRTSTPSRIFLWKDYVGMPAPCRSLAPRPDAAAHISSSGWGLEHSSPSTKRTLGKSSDHWPALCKSEPSDSARHSGVLCLHKYVLQPSIRVSRPYIWSSYCPCLGHICRSPRR